MAIKYRSKFEEEIAEKLKGSRARYEKLIIPFYKIHTYKPDWVLPNGGIIEGQGRFTSYDIAKHLLIKEQQPSLDIRFVFTNSRVKLYKGSKTSYGQWCLKHNFRYYDRIIPEDWLKEKGKNIHLNFIKFVGKKLRR